MTTLPIALVYGATGAQGGAVARALQTTGRFHVRAATRNPASDASLALAKTGVEVIKVDQASDDDVAAASAGAQVVFAVTNHWDPSNIGKEQELARRMAKAARDAGVNHYIWSTLAHISVVSKGKYAAGDFDDKAQVNEFITSLGFPNHSFVRPGFYYENFATFFAPTKAADGTYVFDMPVSGGAYPMVRIADYGSWVLAAIDEADKYGNGAILDAVTETAPMADFVARLGKIKNVPVKFNALDGEAYAAGGVMEAASSSRTLATMAASRRTRTPDRVSRGTTFAPRWSCERPEREDEWRRREAWPPCRP